MSYQSQGPRRPGQGPRPPRVTPQMQRRRALSIGLLIFLLVGFAVMAFGVVRVVREVIGSWGANNPVVEEGEVVEDDPLPPEPVTPPLDFEGFDPGYIISDDVFYDSETMDQDQIQEFLDQVGDGCREGYDGTECIASYVHDSPSYDANDYCYPFEGEADDTAASVVWKAANACGINPQVLLVMLQKEQGLLTASGTGLDAQRYSTAMGYGCPDGGSCKPQYFGLANQVYHAALQLRMYANAPANYVVVPFADNDIGYHPGGSCGASTVYVENFATAGLYNYTPYQPDEDALGGRPGACSAVGNLNFYAYFNAWFG